MSNVIDVARLLKTRAEQADFRYTATIYARTGKTRWTLSKSDEAIPEIAEAYREKCNADEAWRMFLSTR